MTRKPKKKIKAYSLAEEIKYDLPIDLLCVEESSRNNHLIAGSVYKCVAIYEHCDKMYLAVEVMVRGKLREIYYHESRFELTQS